MIWLLLLARRVQMYMTAAYDIRDVLTDLDYVCMRREHAVQADRIRLRHNFVLCWGSSFLDLSSVDPVHTACHVQTFVSRSNVAFYLPTACMVPTANAADAVRQHLPGCFTPLPTHVAGATKAVLRIASVLKFRFRCHGSLLLQQTAVRRAGIPSSSFSSEELPDTDPRPVRLCIWLA